MAHGEVGNGGIPDWIYTKKLKDRTNDPEYQKYVDRFYVEIGKQVLGLH